MRRLSARQLFGLRPRRPTPTDTTERAEDAPGVVMKYPAGHFYSAIPDLEDIRAREDVIFAPERELPGIDLREAQQLELVHELARFYDEQPFPRDRDQREGQRYHFDNIYFGYGDALMLYAMLRHLRPRRMIEVGSGYSSAATLDTNDLFLEGGLQCTFVEPYPKRLRKLLRGSDVDLHEIIEQPVQAVPMSLFERLEANDVLFIDSTHVSKVGSDVNQLVLEVLPRLRPGVVVQIHDVFYPFEYPRAWVYEGRAWNELYLLRAFLAHNPTFRILLFNSYLGQRCPDEVGRLMPLWRRNPGGSLWLQRV